MGVSESYFFFLLDDPIIYIRCHGNLELSFFSDFFRGSNSPLANLARSGRPISLSVRQSNDEFQN